MVVLMVAVAILTVLTAAALPVWSHVMQREKEEELIFRGWQYAEAIRVFQQRHGRYPTRLQELIEVEPRAIRRLWKDPMTESGEWVLVFQGAGANPTDPGRQQREGRREDRDGRPPGTRPPRPGERVTVGPIVGVRSRSNDEAIKTLFGEDSYAGWMFTVERLTGGRGATNPVTAALQRQYEPGAATTALGPPPAQWIGRPFPPGIEVPHGGAIPGGLPGQATGPDGRPAPDDRGRELGGGRRPGR